MKGKTGENVTALKIKDCTVNDIENVVKLVSLLWADTQNDTSAELQSLYNQYVISYYFIPKSDFNLVALENGKICACLLAAKLQDIKNNLADEWIAGQSLPPEVRDHISEFKAGLDSMCEAECQYAKKNEAVLLFFGSVRKGAGKMLMAEFERRCVGQNISSMILWTDERCDFDYYRNKGFDEVAQFPSPVAIDGRRFKTWIFRKNF